MLHSLQIINIYEFHGLWFDPTVARIHDLPGGSVVFDVFSYDGGGHAY
jgi:hypothetical protein